MKSDLYSKSTLIVVSMALLIGSALLLTRSAALAVPGQAGTTAQILPLAPPIGGVTLLSVHRTGPQTVHLVWSAVTRPSQFFFVFSRAANAVPSANPYDGYVSDFVQYYYWSWSSLIVGTARDADVSFDEAPGLPYHDYYFVCQGKNSDSKDPYAPHLPIMIRCSFVVTEPAVPSNNAPIR